MENNNKENLIELILKIIGIGIGAFLFFHAFRFVFKLIQFLING